MKFETITDKIVLIVVAFAFFGGLAMAQNPLTVNVDRNSLTTNETLVLTVEINSTQQNPPPPQLPTMDGFVMQSRGTSSQVSIVNGVVSAKVVYQYILQPTKTGALTIPSIRVTIEGQQYVSEAIPVTVTAGAAPTAPPPAAPDTGNAPTELNGQDLFTEAEVDTESPYLGQQISYIFRFYQGINLFSQPQFEPPAFTGFWNERQPEQTQQVIQAAGRTYQITELRIMLFPTVVGPVELGPSTLTIPGGMSREDLVLTTQPISLTVRPLPEGAPPGFSGAVGQFNIQAQADQQESQVNESVTLRVTLSGMGNIANLPDPAWPELPEWRVFDSQATINTQAQNGRLTGNRVYERLLVPTEAGSLTIPAIEYLYFDPQAEEYVTTRSQPLEVAVAPAEGEEAANLASDAPPARDAVEQVGQDIRYLKAVPSRLEQALPPLTSRPLYWVAWGVPLALLIGGLAWQRRERYLQQNVALVRSSQARKKARQALAAARKQQRDPYAAATQILTDYLRAKLDQPVGGLTQKALRRTLREAGVEAALVERIATCLATAEMGRFSPEASDPAHGEQLLAEVSALIDELEGQL